MADQDAIIFDARSGQRISNAVKWVEGQADDLNSGTNNRPSIYDRTFWARIDSTKKETRSIGEGGGEYYRYGWTEVIRQGDKFVEKTDGRTGTTTSKWAIDSSETIPAVDHVAVGVVVLMKLGYDTSTAPATPTWTFYATPPVVKTGTVIDYSGCAATVDVHPTDDPTATVTLTLPYDTNDGAFIGLNIVTDQLVQYIPTDSTHGILLNPYKSFDVKYKHTTGAPEVPDCESIRFNDTDFTIDPASHGGCSVESLATITWNGFPVEAYIYGSGPVTKCDTKILAFDLADHSVDHTDKTECAVEWAISDDTETDPCHGTTDNLKRTTITASAWVPTAPVYTADEVWIDIAANVISHIGPSTSTATYPTITSVSFDGSTLKVIPKKFNFDSKGHLVSVEDGSDGDALTVDLPTLTITCGDDGTISASWG